MNNMPIALKRISCMHCGHSEINHMSTPMFVESQKEYTRCYTCFYSKSFLRICPGYEIEKENNLTFEF